MGRQRDRTFTGCARCRERKVKCDETRPDCKACRRLGTPCPGYNAKFIWVPSEDSKTAPIRTEGRRSLPCERTWEGFQTLLPALVDFLVARYDENEAHQQTGDAHTAFLPPAQHNPFRVFRLQDGDSDIVPKSDSRSPVSTTKQAISSTLLRSTDTSWDEQFLFHHYVSHVAVLMLPYHHPRNPWKFHYPAAALHRTSPQQKALHSAILAHAAFNVAKLRGGDDSMLSIASENYGKAIKYLLPQITLKTGVDFPVMFAAVMSLMFAEVYSGRPRKWRYHFRGAWTLFEQYRETEPWKLADSACISLQSLIIIKIIGGTSIYETNANHDSEDSDRDMLQHFQASEPVDNPKALAPIMSTPEFGFTIGAPRVVLQCIASISDYRSRSQRGILGPGAMDDLLQKVLTRLNAYRESCDSSESYELPVLTDSEGKSRWDSTDPGQLGRARDEAQEWRANMASQRKAFLYAAYIYLYRVLLDVPPAAVRYYVSQTFASVSSFFATSTGNFSIWPAFIAAAEAYSDEDLAVAREWLDGAASFGLGNRDAIRLVLEEIWRRRESIAFASGISQGGIAVDWRSVMHELNCDVLIV